MYSNLYAYCTYYAYEIYISRLHLIWSEDAVNADTTLVHRDRGKPKEVYDVSENEQFYPEAQKALHTCPSSQHCHAESFPNSKRGSPGCDCHLPPECV